MEFLLRSFYKDTWVGEEDPHDKCNIPGQGASPLPEPTLPLCIKVICICGCKVKYYVMLSKINCPHVVCSYSHLTLPLESASVSLSALDPLLASSGEEVVAACTAKQIMCACNKGK